MMPTLTIALLGRPNVGKSTLFNRLVGKKKALVHEQPGMTRDRRAEEVLINDCTFRIMDTPGLEFPRDTELKKNMWTQSMKALEDADLALWLVDAREGLTACDWEIGAQLRRDKKTVILVANKCEGASHRFDLGDLYKLGFGEPILLSAEHGEGIGDLYDVLFQHYPHPEEALEEELQEGLPSRSQGIRVCIVGRPNAGKSTLLNRWLGEDRVIVTDIPGTTRDSIEVPFCYRDKASQDHQLILVDTAGLRKKAKIQEGMEVLSAQNTLHAIQFSHVVVVLVDATSPLDKQDFHIARHVIEEGRAVVLAINKWDLISPGDREKYKKTIDDMVGSGLSAVSGIPVVYLSALKGKGTDAVLEAVLEVETIWNKALPKSALNSWLERVQEQHLPPLIQGRRLRFKYVNQIKSRPPTFLLFANQTKDVPDSYLRFLTNQLRVSFDLPGVPIRWILRSSRNPYV